MRNVTSLVSPGCKRTFWNPRRSSTLRVTLATGWLRYNCTVSSPARFPVLVRPTDASSVSSSASAVLLSLTSP